MRHCHLPCPVRHLAYKTGVSQCFAREWAYWQFLDRKRAHTTSELMRSDGHGLYGDGRPAPRVPHEVLCERENRVFGRV